MEKEYLIIDIGNNKWEAFNEIIYAPNYETARTRFLNGNRLTDKEKEKIKKG